MAVPPTTLVQIALVVGFLVFLYWNVVRVLVTDWWADASHGLLVPPLVIYIAWLRRRPLLNSPATRDVRGILLICLGCTLLLAGELASEFFVSRVSLVIVIAGLAWTFWGQARMRLLALPLLLLFTMVPLPLLLYNSIALRLQFVASSSATWLAQLAGVAAFREGNVIHLAQVSLGVAEACSGLRSLGSLVVMGLLVGFILCKRFHSRVLIVLATVPIAIVVNILRVSGTAILADYDYRWAMGFYHTFSGWMVFLAGMALTFAMAKAVRRVLE